MALVTRSWRFRRRRAVVFRLALVAELSGFRASPLSAVWPGATLQTACQKPFDLYKFHHQARFRHASGAEVSGPGTVTPVDTMCFRPDAHLGNGGIPDLNPEREVGK